MKEEEDRNGSLYYFKSSILKVVITLKVFPFYGIMTLHIA